MAHRFPRRPMLRIFLLATIAIAVAFHSTSLRTVQKNVIAGGGAPRGGRRESSEFRGGGGGKGRRVTGHSKKIRQKGRGKSRSDIALQKYLEELPMDVRSNLSELASQALEDVRVLGEQVRMEKASKQLPGKELKGAQFIEEKPIPMSDRMQRQRDYLFRDDPEIFQGRYFGRPDPIFHGLIDDIRRTKALPSSKIRKLKREAKRCDQRYWIRIRNHLETARGRRLGDIEIEGFGKHVIPLDKALIAKAEKSEDWAPWKPGLEWRLNRLFLKSQGIRRQRIIGVDFTAAPLLLDFASIPSFSLYVNDALIGNESLLNHMEAQIENMKRGELEGWQAYFRKYFPGRKFRPDGSKVGEVFRRIDPTYHENRNSAVVGLSSPRWMRSLSEVAAAESSRDAKEKRASYAMGRIDDLTVLPDSPSAGIEPQQDTLLRKRYELSRALKNATAMRLKGYHKAASYPGFLAVSKASKPIDRQQGPDSEEEDEDALEEEEDDEEEDTDESYERRVTVALEGPSAFDRLPIKVNGTYVKPTPKMIQMLKDEYTKRLEREFHLEKMKLFGPRLGQLNEEEIENLKGEYDALYGDDDDDERKQLIGPEEKRRMKRQEAKKRKQDAKQGIVSRPSSKPRFDDFMLNYHVSKQRDSVIKYITDPTESPAIRAARFHEVTT
eukprot:jgi/Bigna1/73694/fgenesh1_pg.25_\